MRLRNVLLFYPHHQIRLESLRILVEINDFSGLIVERYDDGLVNKV
jgi:hypothetical protein